MKELIKYDDEIETYAAVITKKKLVYKEEYKLYILLSAHPKSDCFLILQ